jgi:hypothetical protein
MGQQRRVLAVGAATIGITLTLACALFRRPRRSTGKDPHIGVEIGRVAIVVGLCAVGALVILPHGELAVGSRCRFGETLRTGPILVYRASMWCLTMLLTAKSGGIDEEGCVEGRAQRPGRTT